MTVHICAVIGVAGGAIGKGAVPELAGGLWYCAQ